MNADRSASLPAQHTISWFAALFFGALLWLPSAQAADEVYTEISQPQFKPGDEIPAPTEDVVLTVNGKIGATQNGKHEIQFDMPTLEKLGVIQFTTPTNWTDKPVTFDGILVSRLLEVVQADPNAENLVLTALNDYAMTVPAVDSKTWPVMLATKENGNYMSVRDRGPLWVVYPQHAFPELGNRDYLSRWVWQLASITVE